jgi:isoquinoline 1-oxidoreductase beta subunit
MKFPGMLHATVKMNPHRGSRMLGFDASKAETMRGVRAIIPLDNGLIVVATNTWYAMKAADSIRIEWEGAAYPPSTTGHRSSVSDACDSQHFSLPRNDGDVDAALKNAEVLEGEYWVPYLAHATMEPLNATALLQDNRLDIWAGNQFPTRAQALGAEITGLPHDDIHVHTTYMGCGFGRRLEMDFIALAIRAACDLKGVPVNVIWSREEDITQDIYRPMAMARFRAALARGRPGALDLRLSSQSLSGSMRLRSGRPADNKYDRTITLGGADQLYEIANYRVSGHRAPELLPVGWWRSVGESQNCFFHESVIDELAHAAGADPLLMRLEMLTHEPSRQVLKAVGDMSGWGSRLPKGHARGVAYAFSSGAATAQVIEIRDSDAGFELVKACIAVDVGVALDPRIIESQLQSALVFGLSAAMWGEITVEDGKVQQSNFHDYRMLRLHQIPEIEIHIVESGNEIFGVGEAATPGAAPALGNALFAATGRRLRELPFGRFVRFA